MHARGRLTYHRPVESGDGAGGELRALDLFAGAGGLSRGFSDSGHFRTVLAVEMDADAAATFTQNHPGSGVYVGPVQDWLATCPEPPQVDIVIGGPPCQGFSTLGKRDVQDERNTLWREYAKAIVRTNASYFVVENVPAFLRSSQYQQFRLEMMPGGSLWEYDIQADILNAADYGAAQARRRAVLIGHRRDLPFPGWPEKTHEDNPKTVRDVFRDIEGGLWGDLPDRSYTDGQSVFAGPFETRELHVARRYSDLSLQRFACIPPGGNRFNIDEELLAPCWKQHTTGSSDVMGRLHWRRPAVTIRTEFFKPEKGRYLHPQEHRAITHLEAALLQGFPMNYKWVGSKVSIARQIGNAVPIPLAEAIAKQIGKSAIAVRR